MAAVRKVLIFGKTGDGKSTVGNMLINRSLKDPVFPIGSGMEGVTSTCQVDIGGGYEVVDTIGLGEETASARREAKEMIFQFLKRTKGRYHHILFVKSASRYDSLDAEIWDIFLELFQGCESCMVLVVTKNPDPADWISTQRGVPNVGLDAMYPQVYGRYIGVDFQPIHTEPAVENYYSGKRMEHIQTLDRDLTRFHEENAYQWCQPCYTEEDDHALRNRAEGLWRKICQASRRVKEGPMRLFHALFGKQAKYLVVPHPVSQQSGGSSSRRM